MLKKKKNLRFPSAHYLSQNYPNPSNPRTQIKYSVPFNGFVSLKVFNILRKEAATVFEGFQQGGSYITSFDGTELASGIYFYSLQSGKFVDTKKLILLK